MTKKWVFMSGNLMIARQLKSAVNIMTTILFDAFIMVFWVAIQYLVDRGIGYFRLEDFSLIISQVFQLLLAFSTLIPIGKHVLIELILVGKELSAIK